MATNKGSGKLPFHESSSLGSFYQITSIFWTLTASSRKNVLQELPSKNSSSGVTNLLIQPNSRISTTAAPIVRPVNSLAHTKLYIPIEVKDKGYAMG